MSLMRDYISGCVYNAVVHPARTEFRQANLDDFVKYASHSSCMSFRAKSPHVPAYINKRYEDMSTAEYASMLSLKRQKLIIGNHESKTD